MTFAAILLGTVIALILGSAFHFWKGGGLKWLIVFNLFSVIGFWGGHILSNILKIKIISLGPINVGPAIIVSLIVLLGGYWLSMASVESPSEKDKKHN